MYGAAPMNRKRFHHIYTQRQLKCGIIEVWRVIARYYLIILCWLDANVIFLGSDAERFYAGRTGVVAKDLARLRITKMMLHWARLFRCILSSIAVPFRFTRLYVECYHLTKVTLVLFSASCCVHAICITAQRERLCSLLYACTDRFWFSFVESTINFWTQYFVAHIKYERKLLGDFWAM